MATGCSARAPITRHTHVSMEPLPLPRFRRWHAPLAEQADAVGSNPAALAGVPVRVRGGAQQEDGDVGLRPPTGGDTRHIRKLRRR